ncbi:uncharacterized protein LOC129919203 [Episyrphus balteatus]|uniref:uncharacterized protein LOC129919203 n=1 Tax=Episyrphus balteatus TaxID=286459 RepID=UPI0024866E0F|nr:uncharacterized protein LOC129919203 [Episyrphus balteatus]
MREKLSNKASHRIQAQPKITNNAVNISMQKLSPSYQSLNDFPIMTNRVRERQGQSMKPTTWQRTTPVVNTNPVVDTHLAEAYLNRPTPSTALVTETWLNSNISLNSQNYKCYRVDRSDQRGGGVAILIKKSIQHSLLPIVGTRYVENVGVEIRNESYIIGGDLNCRHRDWGCIRANSWGNVLSSMSSLFPYSMLYPFSPTYFPSGSRGSPSVLDLFITNIPSFLSQPETINELNSDHVPVFCKMHESAENRVSYFLDLNNANWSRFKSEIRSKLRTTSTDLDRICSKEDVDASVQTFSNQILDSVQSCVPKRVKKPFLNKMPEHILEYIRIRNSFKRQWQRYRLPEYRIQVKLYDKKITDEINLHRNRKWNNTLSNLDKNAKPFWNIAKIIKNKNRQIPNLENFDEIVYQDSRKADVFASTFSKNHLVAQHLSDDATNQLYFPKTWKHAKIIPIPKPGKPAKLATSYRPISLLSCLSKILEKVLKNKILKIVDEKNILPNEQFGFRMFHSTSHQVLRVCDHVRKNRNLGKSTGLILLDIEKAFDTVWHDGIVHKMVCLGFPVYLVKIVQSFLSNRCFNVFVNNIPSNSYPVNHGVPQGSVLGPFLYNIYTSDIPRLPECQLAIFADDTGIFSSHEFSLNIETNLRHALDLMTKYYTKWKIKLNSDKLQAIFFSRKRKSCFLPSNQLNVNGVNVMWESSVKYLGIYLDQKLADPPVA